MKHDELFSIGKPRPVCIGTGLIALDVILSEQSPLRLWAGGSCCNVLTILSYLGWNAYPVARLGNDPAAAVLLADIQRWRVRTDLISQDNGCSTPVIIEKIGIKKNGVPRHWFEWDCPHCGARLPKYRSVPSKAVININERMPVAKVCYFDRVALSSIALAQENRRRGALIFFEPSAIKDKQLFQQCLQLADIVKYSNERMKVLQGFTFNDGLEIVTSNSKGAMYRVHRSGKIVTTWQSKPAFEVQNFMDGAGAGDWLSAGLIYRLGKDGRLGFERANNIDIENAIDFGQALAALKCGYEGARGTMYCISKTKFKSHVREILSHAMPIISARHSINARVSAGFYCLNPKCKNTIDIAIL